MLRVLVLRRFVPTPCVLQSVLQSCVPESVDPSARVVVIPFAAIKPGETLRLRIEETYTAPVSYRLDGDELVFDRSLGRPRNAVVLPSGWYCTASSVPATVTKLADCRVRLDYWNDRPEGLDVLLKARRRLGGAPPEGHTAPQ